MKASPHQLICVLICLLPTFLAGQANQEQNRSFRTPLFDSGSFLTSRQLTGSPLLRLSNTGPMGLDGIRLDLTSLPVLDAGPSIFIDCPGPMIPFSGSIRLLPAEGGPSLKMMAMEEPGLQMHIGNEPILSSFFDITYDLSQFETTMTSGMVSSSTTFGNTEPVLVKKVSSPLSSGFFKFLDDTGSGTTADEFGDQVSKLSVIRTFDKATPKLLEKIASNNPGMAGFFDVFYDLNLATTGVGFGFDPDDLCLIHKFDNDPPSLLTKIQSSNPSYLNSFFDITYDLDLGTIETMHKNLHYLTQYNESEWDFVCRVFTEDPLIPGFFDITYDLNFGGGGLGAGKVAYSDLLCSNIYDPATPKLTQHVASSNPMFADRFFDISYDLSFGGGGATGKVAFQDLHFSNIYDPATPKLTQHVASSNPMFADRFFDISYDLSFGGGGATGKVAYQDLHFSNIYVPETPKLTQRVTSSNPQYLESFFDITYDLDLGTLRTGYKNLAYTLNASEASTICWTMASNLPIVPAFDVCYDLAIGEQRTEFDDLVYTQSYIDASKSEVSIESLDPSIASFFDITYDIGLADLQKHSIRTGVEGMAPLEMRYEYNALDRKIREVRTDIASGHFFDIEYDLDLGKIKTEFEGLACTGIYDDGTRHEITRTSSLPGTGFFDITYDLSLASLPTFSTEAGEPGEPALELRYEYDALSRKIREVSTDEDNGSSLILERRMLPAASVFSVGGSLNVTGPVSNDVGALLLVDNVIINESLTVNGPKMFRIDHPLDPENKYLIHSCVESPDMMNVYNGNSITNADGFVTVQLPAYFEALNSDYRYQLTCIGQFAQAIIAEKIKDNAFIIQTDKPNVEVSWQVTGIRQDPAALNSGYAVEVAK